MTKTVIIGGCLLILGLTSGCSVQFSHSPSTKFANTSVDFIGNYDCWQSVASKTGDSKRNGFFGKAELSRADDQRFPYLCKFRGPDRRTHLFKGQVFRFENTDFAFFKCVQKNGPTVDFFALKLEKSGDEIKALPINEKFFRAHPDVVKTVPPNRNAKLLIGSHSSALDSFLMVHRENKALFDEGRALTFRRAKTD